MKFESCVYVQCKEEPFTYGNNIIRQLIHLEVNGKLNDPNFDLLLISKMFETFTARIWKVLYEVLRFIIF